VSLSVFCFVFRENDHTHIRHQKNHLLTYNLSLSVSVSLKWGEVVSRLVLGGGGDRGLCSDFAN